LVLPTYDEAENIEAFVTAALENLPASAQVLIVDDNSPDGTGAKAEALAERHGNVSVMHRPRKEGIGPAYIAGFRRALAGGAELILEMDSDFSHDPAYLPRLLDATRQADLVLGSRYVPGGGISDWGPLRRAISRGGSAYARLLLGVEVRDLTGGFKCFRREVHDRGPRLRLPGRDDLPGDSPGLPGRRGADPLPRSPRRNLEDGRLDRGRGGLAGTAHAPGPASRQKDPPHPSTGSGSV
jgi:glycosyltransferase involved in cell wall biosynthesis